MFESHLSLELHESDSKLLFSEWLISCLSRDEVLHRLFTIITNFDLDVGGAENYQKKTFGLAY